MFIISSLESGCGRYSWKSDVYALRPCNCRATVWESRFTPACVRALYRFVRHKTSGSQYTSAKSWSKFFISLFCAWVNAIIFSSRSTICYGWSRVFSYCIVLVIEHTAQWIFALLDIHFSACHVGRFHAKIGSHDYSFSFVGYSSHSRVVAITIWRFFCCQMCCNGPIIYLRQTHVFSLEFSIMSNWIYWVH